MSKYQVSIKFDCDKEQNFTLTSGREMIVQDILSSCFTELKHNEFYFISHITLMSDSKGFDTHKRVFFDYKIETI